MGIWQTLVEMRSLAVAAGGDPDFRDFARRIVSDQPDSVAALESYVFNKVLFEDDPWQYEYVQDPRLMLAQIRAWGYAKGDCDDHVTFLSGLLCALGVPHAMIAVQIVEMDDDLNHVVIGLPMDSQGKGSYKLLDCSMKEYDNILYSIGKTLKIDVLT